jgi:hypothetical protein
MGRDVTRVVREMAQCATSKPRDFKGLGKGDFNSSLMPDTTSYSAD